MLLSFLVVFGVSCSSSASSCNLPWIFGIFGVLFGVLAATIIMSRRAERAAYSQIEGQAGAAGAALTSIRRGWYTDREPVAADVARPGDSTRDAMVYRALRPARRRPRRRGPDARVQKLLAEREEAVERVAPGVPVTTMRVGPGEDEVPLPKLARKVQRSSRRSPRTRWPWSTSASSRSAASARRCRPASTRCAPAWTGRPCAAAARTLTELHLSRKEQFVRSDELLFRGCARGARRRSAARTMTVPGTLS